MAERLDASDIDLGALRKDLDSLRHDIAKLAGTAAHDAKEQVADLADKARDWSGAKAQGLRTTIQEQPLTTIAVALGIGTVIGVLFSRR